MSLFTPQEIERLKSIARVNKLTGVEPPNPDITFLLNIVGKLTIELKESDDAINSIQMQLNNLNRQVKYGFDEDDHD